MKKDLIDTIMEKEFHALTEVEREELTSYCGSEEEYNQMKEVFIGVEQMAVEPPKPKPETKQRLDDLFNSTYPKAAPIWYSSVLSVVIPKEKPMYRQPLVQIAAIALLALLFVPFWRTDTEVLEPADKEQLAQVDSAESIKKEVAQPTRPDENEINTNSNEQEFKSEPSKDSFEEPVLVASAESMAPVTADVVEPMASAGSTASGASHPDGVFIAVSQPASESPEVFDLLTATF